MSMFLAWPFIALGYDRLLSHDLFTFQCSGLSPHPSLIDDMMDVGQKAVEFKKIEGSCELGFEFYIYARPSYWTTLDRAPICCCFDPSLRNETLVQITHKTIETQLWIIHSG